MTTLFQTKSRRGWRPRSIEDVVSKYLKAAGIWRASVRSLRHTFATHQVKRRLVICISSTNGSLTKDA
jgi:site-specific recombinase XerD